MEDTGTLNQVRVHIIKCETGEERRLLAYNAGSAYSPITPPS